MDKKSTGSSPKIFLVCNAHLDPAWLWSWPEGMGAALSTFRVAAEFCENNEEFIFVHNESILYQWVEENDPALFERISTLVKIGRWRIMGGWYLQSDCNMPSGESIVRQMQMGFSYFMEKFGVKCHVACSLDCFGHSKGLVQILKKAGYTGYVFMRPDPGTGLLDDLPQRFRWQGYAGSEIIGYRLNTPYNTLIGKARSDLERFIDDNYDGTQDLMRLWGIGDHGGGPSRADLKEVNELIESKKDQVEIVHSCPEEFIDRLDINTLPRFERDLNPIDAGCYTSMKRVKQLHRRLENQILITEKTFSVCDMGNILPYPADELKDAWKDLLYSEFHDVLPGTCIPTAEEDAVHKLHHGLEICKRLQVKAFYALALAEKAPAQGDIPILIFNPHPYPVTGVFDCEFMLENQNWEGTFTVATVYSNGIALPSQIEKEESSMNLDWRKKIAFKGTLKPMSMNRFDCRLSVVPSRPFTTEDVTGDTAKFVCGDTVYTLDLSDGSFSSIKKNDKEYIKEGFGRLYIYNDNCDPWLLNGKEITDFAGQFTLLDEKEAAAYAACSVELLSSVRIIENGDVRYCIEVLLGWNNSRARVLYYLPKDGSAMQIFYTVHWNEKDKMLRMYMTNSFVGAEYTGQDMFGNKKLHTRHEMVAQEWITAIDSSDDRAMSVINDGCYGFRLREQSIESALLRSPTYSCHFIRDRLMPLNRYYPRMDQGEKVFGFTVLFGTCEEIADKTDICAQVFNEKPMALSFFPDGDGNVKDSFVKVSGARLDTVKKSEDGKAYIFRLYNYHDSEQTVQVDVSQMNLNWSARFEPMEVKTLRADENGLREVNLLEEC